MQVGQDELLAVPSKRGEPQRRVRVLVRTEGPTRVLTVLDTQRHSLLEEMGGPRSLRLLTTQPAETAAAAVAAAAAGGAASAIGSGGSASSSKPPRPWDSWGLLTTRGTQQQSKEAGKMSGTHSERGIERCLLSCAGQHTKHKLPSRCNPGAPRSCVLPHVPLPPLLLPLQACCGRCLLTWHPWVCHWWLPRKRWVTCGRAACALRWRARQPTWCWIWS